jgi:hypothetical protein
MYSTPCCSSSSMIRRKLCVAMGSCGIKEGQSRFNFREARDGIE